MTNADFIALMKGLAQTHREIAHDKADASLPSGKRVSFFRSNGGEEQLQQMSVQIDNPYMQLLPAFGRLDTEDQNRVEDKVSYSFEILMQIGGQMDFDAIDSAQDDCKRIGIELIAELHRLWIDEGYDATLHDFDPNSVRYDAVGPKGNNAYGYRFTLTIDDEAYNVNTIDLDTIFGR